MVKTVTKVKCKIECNVLLRGSRLFLSEVRRREDLPPKVTLRKLTSIVHSITSLPSSSTKIDTCHFCSHNDLGVQEKLVSCRGVVCLTKAFEALVGAEKMDKMQFLLWDEYSNQSTKPKDTKEKITRVVVEWWC